MYAIELLKSEILIPGHYNTFPGQMVDVEDLKRQVAVRAPTTQVVILHPGEAFSI